MDHVAKHGSTGFEVRLAGRRHVFRAPGTTERDLWVPTLTATAVSARSKKENVTSSKGYEELRNRSMFSSPCWVEQRLNKQLQPRRNQSRRKLKRKASRVSRHTSDFWSSPLSWVTICHTKGSRRQTSGGLLREHEQFLFVRRLPVRRLPVC